MSSEIEQIYYNILSIFLDIKSYNRSIEKVFNNNTPEIAINSIVEFLQKNRYEKINSKIITLLKNRFDEIFKDSRMKINYDGFESYLKKITKREMNTKCKHFIDNTNICDNIKDDKPIPIVSVFEAMSCKSCGYFQEDHKICSYYIESSDKHSFNCDTCGLSKFKHSICSKFCGTSNNCSYCGLALRQHQQKELQCGILPCDKYESSTDSYLECKNCIHTEINHMLNPQLFCMNSEAFDKFCDLTLSFQTEFISFNNSPNDLLKYQNLQLSIMNMNYGKQHPLFERFCNVPIVKSTNDVRTMIKFAMV